MIVLMVPGIATFAAELEQARTSQRISYAELAHRSGYAQSYLYDLTRGRRGSSPTELMILRLASALGADPAIFTAYRQLRVCTDHPEAIDRLYHFHAGTAA